MLSHTQSTANSRLSRVRVRKVTETSWELHIFFWQPDSTGQSMVAEFAAAADKGCHVPGFIAAVDLLSALRTTAHI